MTVRGIWLAFAIGVTAGAAVALLYAPQTGSKTRRKLRGHMENAGDYLEDASDYLKDRAGRFGSEAQAVLKQGKKQASSVAGSATDFGASVSRTAKSLF